MSGFIDKAELYRLVDERRAALSIRGPADPYQLAERLGIAVSCYAFESRRLSGFLMRGERHSEIVLNAAGGPESRRFTVAHELIHYLLHSGGQFLCENTGVSQGAVGALEWQANQGAAELLMPYRVFLPFVKNIRSILLSDERRAFRLIAKEFSVGPSTARLRLRDLAPEFEQYCSGVPLEELQIVAASKAKTASRSIDV
ncbi:MAG TPA: ImmA/IrrE family metallo-endopeptidase [Oscillospiraceae bacterium]|nr:ImmA/IrrE family metallo-endopeptidase [Oscillospiraceae bacterium]HNW04901.1 ImmA/IrrE family metallo-endopeptidase [Oscillospiraceae bacterium]HPV99737.1 ImmA/IrrE family metallo-endopeptidase [Oscillospiraceae bacterium]